MEDGERARWAKIAAALVTPEMKKQATAWEAERLIMLEIVANFWKVEAQNFKNFIENTANSDNVSAIVLTALEDIPEGFIGILMGICCPELMDLEALSGTTLTGLFEMLTTGKEKAPLEADASLISADLPPQAMRLLHLARSNALLNFLQNVLLMYQQVDVSVPHLEFGE